MEDLELEGQQNEVVNTMDQDPTSQENGSDDFKFEYEGKEYGRDEVNRVMKDYMNDQSWRAKNTQRSQILSSEMEKLEELRKVEDYLKTNPGWDGKFVEWIKANGYGESGVQSKKVNESGIQRFGQNEDLNNIKSELENIKLEKEFDKLRGNPTYKQFFEEDKELDRKVASYMLENGIYNVNTAFRDMMFDNIQNKMLEKGISQGKEGILKGRRISSPNGSGIGIGKGKVEIKGKGLQGLKESMMADDRIQDL